MLSESRVPYTRGHIRTAVVLLAATGLTAAAAATPTIRNSGALVLGTAAGLTLHEDAVHSDTSGSLS